MNLLKSILLISLLAVSSDIYAIDYMTCKSKFYQTLEQIENTGHSPIYAKPKGDLLKLSKRYEILCPWQIEADFNGDNKIDWIGILQKKGKYELVAYLSGPKKHFVRVIKQYKEFPNDVFLTKTSYQWLFKTAKGKVPSIFPAKFVLSENKLNESSNAFGWVNQKLKNIYQYNNEISFKDLSDDED